MSSRRLKLKTLFARLNGRAILSPLPWRSVAADLYPFIKSLAILVLLLIALVALGMMVAQGCGWPGPLNTVRFNYSYTERELERLPPLDVEFEGMKRSTAFKSASVDDGIDLSDNSADANDLFRSANAAESAGDIAKVRILLNRYLGKSRISFNSSYNYSPQSSQSPSLSDQERRNSAIDRLDAIAGLSKGAPLAEVKCYLAARQAYDLRVNEEEISEKLSCLDRSHELAGNAAYLRAALLYRSESWSEAEAAFDSIAKRFPNSTKNQAAIYMTALAALKQTVSESLDDEADSRNDAVINDEAWGRARRGFQRILREFPNGRFAGEARGWIAHLALQHEDTAGALAEYYRLLSTSSDPNIRITALISIRMVRPKATEEELNRLEMLLESDPRASLTYAYHNLYNFAPSGSLWEEREKVEARMIDEGHLASDEYGSLPEWARKDAEKQARKNIENSENATRQRVARFAARMMNRFPGVQFGDSFALRVAEANLETGDNTSALKIASQATRLPLQREQRDEALWVTAVAQHRLRFYSLAIQTLRSLIQENPTGKLSEGARRLLALTLEDSGDLDGALEQYITLDYNSDVAYYVDVLMTPEQLAGFIQTHSQIGVIDELWYSLGVRYMRKERWDEARSAFAHVKISKIEKYETYDSDDESGSQRTNTKLPNSSFGFHVISDNWVLRDIKTVNDLQRLQFNAAIAQGEEAKAEALYQYASYIYQGTNLLFYNPLVWGGERYALLSDYDYNARYRLPNESQLLWEYTQEHEATARALNIYLEIARLYPRTRAARDALYTAAVCHDRLSGFNPYWRDKYKNGIYAGERYVKYSDVRTVYPGYRFPSGTWGWEPATRTVNGKTAWPPEPKPVPRPSRWQRLQRVLMPLISRCGNAFVSAKNYGKNTLVPWAFLILAMEATLLSNLLARHARRRFPGQFSRFRRFVRDSTPAREPMVGTFLFHRPWPVEAALIEYARTTLFGLWMGANSYCRSLNTLERRQLGHTIAAHLFAGLSIIAVVHFS